MPKRPSTKNPHSTTDTPIHPGQHVRAVAVDPKELTVQAAAKLVGVGRPAFSKFLNGRASTTSEMAARIELAFGISARDLLDLQARYDAAQAKAKGTPANARPYVAPFLGITAKDIEDWVTRNIAARSRLAVFLRTLVNSTSNGLTRVDFPGNDDSQRPGWDGYVEATHPTPWIPEGTSGWEFGTNESIQKKANSDFTKSVNAMEKAAREQMTFVFVTPRNWPAKEAWVLEQKSARLWKDVRAYDSSDLEQWLEQSVAGQAWLANEARLPSEGARTLDQTWSDWADVAHPPLTGSLFTSAIAGAKQKMQARLSKPPTGPIVVTADSAAEALAFLTQLFGLAGGVELAKYRDRVVIFDKPGVLPRLAQGTRDFIAVAATREVERELGPLARSMHTIVVHPRNSANANPCVELQPLTHESFRVALEEMGCSRDDIKKLAKESGRSLTVLRRRLSKVPAVCTPEWAVDHETSVKLIPFLLIGAWCSTNLKDRAALAQLARIPYEDIERDCQRLAALDDAPLWSVGAYRGTVSKIDTLFAVSASITEQDLQRYFDLARLVLGEDDPTLDLPSEQRWAAAIHGKSRGYSATLRKGVCETLVLLAVHGNDLFHDRLGVDCEVRVNHLIGGLLTPLNARVLEANDRDLPSYAEAAPELFLSILEEDLKSDRPETYELLRPAESGVLGGGCPRTGLLWALENLAWSRETLHRVALILAQLAEIEITDNWMNKPISSLQSIFSAWMPQTDPDHQTRVNVMKLLANQFPKIAWKLCLEPLETGPRMGHYSHKPTWRNDGYGFGEPCEMWKPYFDFMTEMADLALTWHRAYTSEMLCDLIQHLHALDDIRQARAWDLVTKWAATATDADKAIVREKVRVAVLSRRGVKRAKLAGQTTMSATAKAAFEALEPADIVNKHGWLFREQWVEESADDLHDDDTDFQKREARINKLRVDALREVLKARGLPGIFELAAKGKAATQIGWLMISDVLLEAEKGGFLTASLPLSADNKSWPRNLINGALRALDDEERVALLLAAKETLTQADFLRLLLLAPFRRSTWELVDLLTDARRQEYWKEVSPEWIQNESDEGREAVERLLIAKRPRAAFSCVHFRLDALESELLFRLMFAIVKESDDAPGHYQLDHYDIEKVFRIIDQSPVFTLEQKAELELAYIDALSRRWDEHASYGIPNLEKYVEQHPETYVQAVVWTYRRDDKGEDPPEWTVAIEQAKHLAERGYRLLDGLSRIPGHNHRGELDLNKLATWIKTVREACARLSRLEIADLCIGKLLARAPADQDGVWPCEPVRQVMEDVHSRSMMRGAHTGLYNSRGVVLRGDGGEQERDLANKYQAWANALRYSHPFVASELLMGLVNTYKREANREDAAAGVGRRLE
jgi:addiction module HigA family antidote